MTARLLVTGMILMIVLVMVIPGGAFAPKGSPVQTQSNPQQNPQTSPIMRAYGAFWQEGDGYASTLVVRNKDDKKAVAGTVVIYSHEGKEESRTPINVARVWPFVCLLRS